MFVYTLSEVIGLSLFVVMCAVAAIVGIVRFAKARACSHERYYENGACDAICRDCGENLGFIATVRKNRQ